MMAVIFFCLRLLAPTDSKGSAHKHAAIWQLGSYIWVPPPENPQGLGQLYVRRPFVCKEKSAEFVEFRGACGKFRPRCPGTPNSSSAKAPNRTGAGAPALPSVPKSRPQKPRY